MKKNKHKQLPYYMIIFGEVVRTGSFTDAAENLGLTKSAVSQHINQLESIIDSQLLVRTTRSLTLTSTGRIFARNCESLETLLNQTEMDIQEYLMQPSGVFTITAPYALAHSSIVPSVGELVEQFPKIRPRLIIDDRVKDIVKHSVDLAIRVGDLPDSNYKARRIGSICNVLAASPMYLNNTPTIRQIKDLERHTFIAANWQHSKKMPILYDLKGNPAELRFKQRYKVNNSISALEMARLHNGIVLLPNVYIHALVKKGELLLILPEYRSEFRIVNAVHPFQGKLPIHVSFFIEHLAKMIPDQSVFSD